MSVARAALILAVLSLLGAGAVALASREPSSVRMGAEGRAQSSPELGASFSDEDVARHGSYRGPLYLAFAIGALLEIAALVILARGPFATIVEAVERIPGSWAVHALAAGVVIAIVLAAVGLPLGYVTGFAMARAWGLSTQGAGGWATDVLRSMLVSAVVAGISALAFFAVIRWQPRYWWVVGWAAFTLLTALLTFLWPVVIAPLFNKFTPLPDGALKAEIVKLADDAGVELSEVLVADASRRTTAENAYVAGLGASKQMVLYDTLLKSGSDRETEFIAAHELGHEVHGDVLKGVGLAGIGLLVGFALLAFLSGGEWMWSWAGASGPGDLRGLPVLVLYAAVVTLVLLPVQNTVSRHFESQADAVALRLTQDPDTAVRVFRRLAFSNISDLRPPSIAVWALFSHPPVVERIENARNVALARTSRAHAP